MIITEADKQNLRLDESAIQLLEAFDRRLNGEDVAPPSMKEFLATPAAQVLMPRVIMGQVRKAAEPMYLGTKLLRKIRMPQAQGVVMFPSIGVMRAFGPLGEGQEIPEDTFDWTQHEGSNIRIAKYGVRVRYSQEMVDDSQWDVLSMLLEQAGRAMARLKEELAFRQFSMHGHTVFDNALYAQDPVKYASARTSGLGYDGLANDTMGLEDWIDLLVAGYNNEMNPDMIMLHPLAWSAFAKTQLYGGWNHSLVSPNVSQPEGGIGSIKIGPEAMQGRVPFPFSVQMSPFIPLDKVGRRYDMYVVDSKNVGVLIEREALTTEAWDEPARDIKNIKLKERYGMGVLLEGRAIAVAKNVKLDAALPMPTRIKQL